LGLKRVLLVNLVCLLPAVKPVIPQSHVNGT